jgi:hypothetical protein
MSGSDPTCAVCRSAFNGSFCQKLPLARRQTVWQQRAPIQAIHWPGVQLRKPPFDQKKLVWSAASLAAVSTSSVI